MQVAHCASLSMRENAASCIGEARSIEGLTWSRYLRSSFFVRLPRGDNSTQRELSTSGSPSSWPRRALQSTATMAGSVEDAVGSAAQASASRAQRRRGPPYLLGALTSSPSTAACARIRGRRVRASCSSVCSCRAEQLPSVCAPSCSAFRCGVGQAEMPLRCRRYRPLLGGAGKLELPG